jgi:hypothetical protein
MKFGKRQWIKGDPAHGIAPAANLSGFQNADYQTTVKFTREGNTTSSSSSTRRTAGKHNKNSSRRSEFTFK